MREREREKGGLSDRECGRGFHCLIDMCQACRMHHCLAANTPSDCAPRVIVVPSSILLNSSRADLKESAALE